jgi:hypothetical protein
MVRKQQEGPVVAAQRLEGARLSRRQMLEMAGAATVACGLSAAAARSGETTSASGFRFPATGVEVRQAALLLAIDDVSLPLKKNLCYYLSRPKVCKEPVLVPSLDKPKAPDSLAAHFYGTVLHDGGKFRLWYYPCHTGLNPDWPPDQQPALKRYQDKVFMGPLCYAESKDGISWTKPNLRLMRFKGSYDHNALNLPEALTSCATVIKDDADPDPGRRYKMVYEYLDLNRQGDLWGTMRTAVSPDGLHWKVGSKVPVDDFVEFASFYKHQGLYLVNAHTVGTWQPGEGGSQRGRQGVVWVSPDFDHWLQESAESFTLPEPRRPEDRGGEKPYDQVHLGTGAASFGNVLVGLYGLWHNNPAFEKISGDFGLVVSNDGIAFREPVKGHVYLAAAESPVARRLGKVYPTVLTQANGILNVGDETRVYHGRWHNSGNDAKNYYGEIALATLPRDRWGALGLYPDAREGSVWSTPVTLPPGGCAVFLNAEGAKGMRVEVADDRFRLLPPYSGMNSGLGQADAGFDCPVKWPAGDLAALAGQTVRLRVHVKKGGIADPRLYAVSLKRKE